MLQNDSGFHENREDRVPKNTSRNAPNKCSRTSHPNLPKPFHSNHVHNRQSFPTDAMDDTLNQIELTCNLLRGARLNPRLSAHEYLHGRFDYNATPLAPIGIRVLAYEGPDKRGTWSPHGLDAWYLGPAYEHYRCYRVWIWETKAERYTDTVAWFPPPHIKMPVASKADLIVSCINDIVKIISEPFHGTIDPLTDSDVHALAQTTSLLIHHAEEAPIAPAPAPLLRVPAPAPELRVPAPAPELRVPLETYQNRVKPVNQREPRLPSTSLCRSPRNHPLTLQANAAEDSALDSCVRANATADSALGPYHTNVDEYAMRRSRPPPNKQVKFAIDLNDQDRPQQRTNTQACSSTTPP